MGANQGRRSTQIHFNPTNSITTNILRFIQRVTKRLTELLWHTSVLTFLAKWIFFVLWSCDPTRAMASSLLRLLNHTHTHSHTHSRWDSFGRAISSSRRLLPDNTQHSQQTDIYGRGGIRTRSLSRRVTADVRLRPRGIYIHRFI